jgi:hypothetical protein
MEWVVLPCMNLFVLVMTTSLEKLFVLRETQLQFKVFHSAVPIHMVILIIWSEKDYVETFYPKQMYYLVDTKDMQLFCSL